VARASHGRCGGNGERQRLRLAPARCYADRISSCSTNAIDVEGENAVFERLLRATPRPTIVMIAHRLESLRHCQRVLLFEGGTMVSEGSGNTFRAHDESRELVLDNQDLNYRRYR
jgi:ABC-type bacteriocin/lantibiotic exporter with double-glycine peptidase domain